MENVFALFETSVKDPPCVAVIGAGAGGRAMAAHLSLAGCEVRLYDCSHEVVQGLRAVGGVNFTVRDAGQTRIVKVAIITDKLSEAVRGADVIAVVVPASSHEDVAQAIEPFLVDGQIVWLHPGATLGTLEIRRVLQETFHRRRVLLAEADNLIYACNRTQDFGVCVNAVKKRVLFAALPSADTDEVLSKLKKLYPQLIKARNVLEVGLSNVGVVLHPATMLLNTPRIELERGNFEFFAQGVSPGVSRVMELVDRERVAIAQAFGIRVPTLSEWVRDCYNVEGEDYFELIQNLNRQRFKHSPAPDCMSHRYISEDVPYGIVPMISVGSLVGADTYYMRTLARLASIIVGVDYTQTGRTLERLGLSGLDPRGVLSLVDGV